MGKALKTGQTLSTKKQIHRFPRGQKCDLILVMNSNVAFVHEKWLSKSMSMGVLFMISNVAFVHEKWLSKHEHKRNLKNFYKLQFFATL